MKEALSSLIAVNKRRPDYLIIILREIKAISEDHRLRPQLLRSLRALQDTQTLMSNPLVSTQPTDILKACSFMNYFIILNSEIIKTTILHRTK